MSGSSASPEKSLQQGSSVSSVGGRPGAGLSDPLAGSGGRQPEEHLEALGEWCVRNGLATAEEIDLCLEAQRSAEKAGGVAPRLGEILVARGILTGHQVAEALASQRKQIRQCPHCGIQINVPVRGDVADYRCGRCNGPLTRPDGTPPLNAVDEPFILISKEPLPREVEEALQSPDARFGKYVLLRMLGRGGIGAVYLAWDTYLSQYVALKRLLAARKASPQDTPSDHVQSLLKEARNTIRLRHPGVVSVFDVGRVGSEYYVAMEYLQGDTLADRINAARSQGRPSPYYESSRQTLIQLAEIARAVDYAHRRPSPIVHCDLKPANILIDLEGHAHVLDFGLARNLAIDAPEKGEISGTPSYMAPEQASGESDKIDQRTDVYAFGAMLYEMLTGRPPFVGGTIEVLGQTIGEEPNRPSDILHETTKNLVPDELAARVLMRVPPALENLCMRCLRKDRSLRPQSMSEVAEELEANLRPAKPAVPPASPAAPASPVKPGHRSPSRRAARRVAIAAGVIVGGCALLLPGWRARNRDQSFESEEHLAVQALSKFQPRSALEVAKRLREGSQSTLEQARASGLSEEATWVLRLQNRVARRIASAPLAYPGSRLRGGLSSESRITSSDASAIWVSEKGRPQAISWESLEPERLIEFLEAALNPPDESDLLGLGILCLRMDRTAEAQRYFRKLRSSSLAPVAERYLPGSND